MAGRFDAGGDCVLETHQEVLVGGFDGGEEVDGAFGRGKEGEGGYWCGEDVGC